MKILVDSEPVEETQCDTCSEEAVVTCYFCGKDLCLECIARVLFHDKVVVREKPITFIYDKYMCKSHLPSKRSCE